MMQKLMDEHVGSVPTAERKMLSLLAAAEEKNEKLAESELWDLASQAVKATKREEAEDKWIAAKKQKEVAIEELGKLKSRFWGNIENAVTSEVDTIVEVAGMMILNELIKTERVTSDPKNTYKKVISVMTRTMQVELELDLMRRAEILLGDMKKVAEV
ncbi:MAG: hypothetical protein LE178_03230 [Endomicrobium sp.]|nr:hypothetical protein [Endomicrobium sp.]